MQQLPLSPACGSPVQPRHERRPFANSVRYLSFSPDHQDQLLPSSTSLRFPPPTRGLSYSALRLMLTPTMASADFCKRISTPFDVDSTWHACRSPRVLRTHLHAYARRIYVAAFRASIGLRRYLPAHPAAPPLSASCTSGQRFAFGFLRIRSRPRHPCRSANTSPCRVCRGLSPPSTCALPGAPKKSPAEAGLLEVGPRFQRNPGPTVSSTVSRACECSPPVHPSGRR